MGWFALAGVVAGFMGIVATFFLIEAGVRAAERRRMDCDE
jgi:hypothetical protein